uniref:PPM-type phosphatase domain-containing protein n=1 Tax=Trypanosoma congolense (strain IL3000) TaxID=1068625 RepID=G0UWE3_TRYCI|nr:putative protein phosphatase 2C [Trypanosoma congolense IL3000]
MSAQAVLQAFPLQHKKMSRFTLPFLRVGVCEVMNCAEREFMSSFTVQNTRNRRAYAQMGVSSCSSAANAPLSADIAAAGLFDSYNGHSCSRFVSQYLATALSTHSVLPEEVARMRREQKEEQLVAIIMSSLSRRRTMHRKQEQLGEGQPVAQPIFSEWDMQQYAMAADLAFLRGSKACGSSNFVHDSLSGNEGCRAVWFTASVAPFTLREQRSCEQKRVIGSSGGMAPPPLRSFDEFEDARRAREISAKHETALGADNRKGKNREAPSYPFCLDVLVSNVGDSRAFGIARNPLTWGRSSLLDPTRQRTVPLSVDHHPLRTMELRRIVSAGGVVRSDAGDVIDGNPFYNVSRSFGHSSMKCNPNRSPSEQKLIAVPTCNSWEMLPGDVLVLCNRSIFETRSEDVTSIDEVAKVVAREIDRGSTPEVAAGTLCDYALRFGAGHSLQVLVAVADDVDGSQQESGEGCREEWVVPGPIYPQPCRHSPAYCAALLADCNRCGVTFPQLLELRWRRIRSVLACRHDLPFMPYYGKECSALQQVMDEEALLFSDDSLPTAEKELEKLSQTETNHMKEVFRKLSNSIISSKVN